MRYENRDSAVRSADMYRKKGKNVPQCGTKIGNQRYDYGLIHPYLEHVHLGMTLEALEYGVAVLYPEMDMKCLILA